MCRKPWLSDEVLGYHKPSASVAWLFSKPSCLMPVKVGLVVASFLWTVPRSITWHWLGQLSQKNAPGTATFCPSPHGWGCVLQQTIPQPYVRAPGTSPNQDNITKEQLGTAEQSDSWQQHSTALIFSVPFLWLSTQTSVPFEGTQSCVILSYRQICVCH